ncbi:hypothetical protein M5689_015212 [Euphorbia peplus]|nr:hypothetical protein M5689_015212 [Euphorbia peplus]
MASPSVYIVLISLLLGACTIAARKDVGEYWKDTSKQDNIVPQTVALKTDCHNSEIHNNVKNLNNFDHDNTLNEDNMKEKFVKDFEDTPNVSIYKPNYEDNTLLEKKKFVKDFEDTPNVSIYKS